MRFACPNCFMQIAVEHGNWPFVQTQVRLHLDSCEETQRLRLPTPVVIVFANQVADELLGLDETVRRKPGVTTPSRF
jgi:hypothetical protein